MQIGIFTIIKDEQEYLKEWLDYHLSTFTDITTIYIFDDPNSTSHQSITEQYSKVEYHNILEILPIELQRQNTPRPRQITYLYQVLDYLKASTDLTWVFYLDLDEFLTTSSSFSLSTILTKFIEYDILALSWKNYNANGHITKPKGRVLETFTQTCKLLSGKSNTLRTSSKLCFNLTHWDSSVIETSHHLPKRAKWCRTDFSNDKEAVVYDLLYIRHYITKSFEEFCRKIYIRGQFHGSKTLNSFFNFNPDIDPQDSKVQKILSKY